MANTLTFANRTITDAELFGDIAYTADLNDGDEFTIGNTASASVEFVTDIQLPLYSKDTVNGTFTWTKDSTAKGRYYITEVTKEDGFYTVTAYDAMILLETNVSALSLTFPLSVSAAASAIATYIGCTVSGTIYNGSLTVSALDDNMTIRELLGYVAEASGCSVKIDGSDHLCFMYYEDSGITLTASDYKKINIADYSCTAIDRVTIFDSYGNLKAEAGTGDNALYIQGNPFLEEAQTAAAQAILGNVSGIVYTPLTCELFDEEGLEIGTMATFGTTQTLIMHLESSESGAMAQSVGSDTRAEYNKSADIVASEARVLAEAALETAENTDQYFWMASTGSDTGVHITEVPREDFIADPQNGGGNLVAKSSGVAVRDGLTELANFGETVTIGKVAKANVTIPTETSTVVGYHSDIYFNYNGETHGRITAGRNGNTKYASLMSDSGYLTINNNTLSDSYSIDANCDIKTTGDIYPQNTLMADFVVTNGVSGNWQYRKWKSGKTEAWYTGSVSCSAATAVNSVYRSSYSLSIPSGIFSSAPNVNMSIDQNASTLMAVMGYASSATAISGYVFRTGSQSSTYTATLSVYAWNYL